MRLNKNSGFTLLEIIIVIIIVGVLASLALPRFFSTVEFSRSTEALNSLGVIRQAVERCRLVDNDVTACDVDASDALEFDEIDIDDPGVIGGAHFTYVIDVTGSTGDDYTVTATRNAVDSGDGASTIALTVTNDIAARSGTGAFSSIR